jgi:hypothetical protein
MTYIINAEAQTPHFILAISDTPVLTKVGGEFSACIIPPRYRKKFPIRLQSAQPIVIYNIHDTNMSISKSETDIILNKAHVALARSQRLVASWLPPPTDEEKACVKTEEELQREEDEIFTAVPETYVPPFPCLMPMSIPTHTYGPRNRLGVGAPLPEKAADGSWNRTELDSNDKLRKQLLGKNYKKVMAASAGVKLGKPVGQNGVPAGNTGDAEDDDDDEEGRTAVVGRKGDLRKKAVDSARKRKATTDIAEDDGIAPSGAGEIKDGNSEDTPAKREGPLSRSAPGPRGRKKATSFLDEILADRSKKRKKR